MVCWVNKLSCLLLLNIILSSPFPYCTETILVRVYEERMDLLRAVIIGPVGTPYHDGLFFFDFQFPSNYPHIPPVCEPPSDLVFFFSLRLFMIC